MQSVFWVGSRPALSLMTVCGRLGSGIVGCVLRGLCTAAPTNGLELLNVRVSAVMISRGSPNNRVQQGLTGRVMLPGLQRPLQRERCRWVLHR